MCVRGDLLVAGGFNGELVAKRTGSATLSYASRITHDENAITNAIEVHAASPAAPAQRIVTSNNDCAVRVFDAATFGLLHRFDFPWAANFSTLW